MLLLLDTSYFRYPCMVAPERGRKEGWEGGRERGEEGIESPVCARAGGL